MVIVTEDLYNYEVSWELSCDGLPAPITGGSPYEEMHGVPPGSCNLTLMDSFGDGWQGAAWTAPGWTDQSFTLTALAPPPPQPHSFELLHDGGKCGSSDAAAALSASVGACRAFRDQRDR